MRILVRDFGEDFGKDFGEDFSKILSKDFSTDFENVFGKEKISVKIGTKSARRAYVIGTTFRLPIRTKRFRLPIRTIFRTKRFSERAACGPPWARIYIDQSIIIIIRRRIITRIRRRKRSFKSAQIFFRESLGTPLDEKSVICRIYTYPT